MENSKNENQQFLELKVFFVETVEGKKQVVEFETFKKFAELQQKELENFKSMVMKKLVEIVELDEIEKLFNLTDIDNSKLN